MTPDESKSELLSLMSRTIDVVEGGEWTLDESGAADCFTAEGHKGVQFDVQRSASSGALNPEMARNAAEKVWTAHGVDSYHEVLGKDVALILAHRPDETGFFLEFTVSEKGMNLWGKTSCVPGEASALHQKGHDDRPSG